MMCSAWPRHAVRSRRCWLGLGASLSITVLAPLAGAQETCQSASVVPIGAPVTGSNAASADDGGFGLCVPTAHDVWYTFTPGAAGNYTISLCGSSFDTVLALYADCADLPLDCNDDACGQQSVIAGPLAAGQPYYVRIASHAGQPGGTYRLEVTPPPAAPPANNACGGGAILPPNQPTAGSNAGATGSDSNGACGGDLDRADVWYSFVPSAGGLHVVELCTTAFDGVLSVHSSCFNSTLIGCGDDDAVEGCPPGAGSRVAFNAVAGTPVLIRVAGAGGSFGAYSLTIHTAAANDLCSAATPVTRGNTFTGTITPAVSTEGVASCAPSAHDVWHTYVATVAGAHTFSLCSSSLDAVLSVYSGCPGTPGAVELACNDDAPSCGPGGASEVVADLQPGGLYYIRIAGKTSGGATSTGAYRLRVDVTTPSNDSCSSPVALSPGVPVVGMTYGATGPDGAPCGAGGGHDVWYSFTPGAGGAYAFNTCGSAINTTLALFGACAGAPLACSEDGPAFCGGGASGGSRVERILSAGTTYLVRVAGLTGADGVFRLVVNRTPPVNDACAAPVALTPGVPASGTLTGATPSGTPFCDGLDTPDIYFAFTPTQDRYYRFSTCGSGARTVLGLYGDCPPAPGAACAASAAALCPGGASTDLVAALRAGVTYRVRVSAAPGESAGSVQLTVNAIDPPGDDCARAQPLTLDGFVDTSTVGATGADVSPCGAGDSKDVWFGYTPDLTGTYEFLTCALSGPAPDTTITLFDGCGGAVLACNDDGPGACAGGPAMSRVAYRLAAGQTYFVRAALVGGAEGAFSVGVRYARPTNDTCAAALTVVEGAIAYDTLGAQSEGLVTAGCGEGFNNIGADVFFRYVAPASGPVIVSACDSTFDTAVAVLDGSLGCGGGLPVLACNDDYDCDGSGATENRQSRTVFNAVTGGVYLIRVGSIAGDRGSGTLNISRPGGTLCPCDWNGTDGRSLQDVFDFLQDWFAGQGDFNQSGTSDLQDLFEFLTCYLTNPPECR